MQSLEGQRIIENERLYFIRNGLRVPFTKDETIDAMVNRRYIISPDDLQIFEFTRKEENGQLIIDPNDLPKLAPSRDRPSLRFKSSDPKVEFIPGVSFFISNVPDGNSVHVGSGVPDCISNVDISEPMIAVSRARFEFPYIRLIFVYNKVGDIDQFILVDACVGELNKANAGPQDYVDINNHYIDCRHEIEAKPCNFYPLEWNSVVKIGDQLGFYTPKTIESPVVQLIDGPILR